MITVKIQLSDIENTSKPKNAGFITKEIEGKIQTVTIREFADAVGKDGRTFTPAVFNGARKIDNFVSQQVFVLDFDDGFTIDEFMARAKEYDMEPAIIYETFSSTRECEKFRVIFINDVEVEDKRAAEIMIKMLLHIFPEADTKCRDVARMFFGGNKLVHINENPQMINFVTISKNVYLHKMNKDKKNLARAMRSVADELGVALYQNNLLMIEKVSESEEKIRSTCIYIHVKRKNSSFFYALEINKMGNGATPETSAGDKKKTEKMLKKRTLKELREKCPLLNDFYMRDLPHDLKFLLATNLLYIEGGHKIFMNALEDNKNKWEVDWRYMQATNYKPKSCNNGNCPYRESCCCYSLYSKLQSSIQRIGQMKSYVDIDTAYTMLEDKIHYTIKECKYGIHLIKAMTALGKTTAFCNFITENELEKPVMIVVPTIKLQEEIGLKLKYLGVNVYLTPNLERILSDCRLDELWEWVKGLYTMGYDEKTKSEIQKYISEHEHELSEVQIKKLKDYLKSGNCLDGTQCVITTHAMFLRLKKCILEQYEIIVDEDILMTIFKGTESISFECLEQVLKLDMLPVETRETIKRILQGKCGDDMNIFFSELSDFQISELFKDREKLKQCGSFPRFFKSRGFCVDAGKRLVYYFDGLRIPNIKMTIVSATLNEKLYKDYLRVTGDDREVCMHEIPEVRYKGTIQQYMAESMSRKCISQHGFSAIMKRIREMLNMKNECKCITFKMYSHADDIYFGKTEGVNDYKGKDIIIVGTPHNLPVVYELLGGYLGYRREDTLAERRVVHNGCEFPIMTFEDVQMRGLQFYFLESELEQAIGRARLLRYKCNVSVFSNFPCSQAEIITTKYLNGLKKIQNKSDIEDGLL